MTKKEILTLIEERIKAQRSYFIKPCASDEGYLNAYALAGNAMRQATIEELIEIHDYITYEPVYNRGLLVKYLLNRIEQRNSINFKYASDKKTNFLKDNYDLGDRIVLEMLNYNTKDIYEQYRDVR